MPEIDKLVHGGLFLLLAVATRWRFGPRLGRRAAVTAYGVLSEIAQAVLLPDRSGDPSDALADTTGALLGWLLARWWQRIAR